MSLWTSKQKRTSLTVQLGYASLVKEAKGVHQNEGNEMVQLHAFAKQMLYRSNIRRGVNYIKHLNIEDSVYWKCLVMSPGSEISLGMQVIISVLATCNTKCNYHE